MRHDWPLWEVFVRAVRGLERIATLGAFMLLTRSSRFATRATPTRRLEGVSRGSCLDEIVASDPAEAAGRCSSRAEDKIYRHPTFYDIPDVFLFFFFFFFFFCSRSHAKWAGERNASLLNDRTGLSRLRR